MPGGSRNPGSCRRRAFDNPPLASLPIEAYFRKRSLNSVLDGLGVGAAYQSSGFEVHRRAQPEAQRTVSVTLRERRVNDGQIPIVFNHLCSGIFWKPHTPRAIECLRDAHRAKR